MIKNKTILTRLGNAALMTLIILFASTALCHAQTKVKIGMSSSSSWIPIQIAVEKGFFKQRGLDAEIQLLASAPDTAKALVVGELDFAALAVERSVQATQQGKQIFNVLTIQTLPPSAILVTKNSTFKAGDFKSLKGKTVGVVFGGWSEVLVRYMLKKNNMAWEDINVLSTANPSTMISALQSGQVDALSAIEPVQSTVIANNSAKVFFDMEDPETAKTSWPNPFVATTLQATAAFVKKNPLIVKAVVEASAEGLKYVLSNQASVAADLAKKNVDTPADVWTVVISRLSNTWSPDGAIEPKGYVNVQNVLVENGKLDKALPVEEVIYQAN